MKKLILSAVCVAALSACSGMDSSSRMGSSRMGSSSTGASSMGSTGSSSMEQGGTTGANRAQTTSGAYTAPGTSTMPGK